MNETVSNPNTEMPVPEKADLPEAEVLEAQERIAEKNQEELPQSNEQEKNRIEKERTAEHERHTAEEEASSESDSRPLAEKGTERDTKAEIPTQANRKHAYKEIMAETQAHMSRGEKTFSSFIHNPVVEKISEAGAKTVVRPNAVLAGSMSAFFLVLTVYLVSRYFGYPLSGAESIFAFAAGWLIGILYDFFKIMITGKHS